MADIRMATKAELERNILTFVSMVNAQHQFPGPRGDVLVNEIVADLSDLDKLVTLSIATGIVHGQVHALAAAAGETFEQAMGWLREHLLIGGQAIGADDPVDGN